MQEACTGMERALRALCNTRDTSRPRPERAAVAAACQLAKLEASKLALLYSEPGVGGVPEAHGLPLVGGLQSAVCALCSLLEGAAARGGPTLRRVLEAAASAVVAAASALARGAISGAGGRPGAVVHLAGVALASIDDAARVPLDNRTAVGREVTKASSQGPSLGFWEPSGSQTCSGWCVCVCGGGGGGGGGGQCSGRLWAAGKLSGAAEGGPHRACADTRSSHSLACLPSLTPPPPPPKRR